MGILNRKITITQAMKVVKETLKKEGKFTESFKNDLIVSIYETIRTSNIPASQNKIMEVSVKSVDKIIDNLTK